jgi:ribosomal protein S18 acetylase RimI-like enzyme
VPYEIVHFRPEHAGAFYSLNREWLDAYGIYEPPDEAQLVDPEGTIVAEGGTIFVALDTDEVVGTAALVPFEPGAVELVKLAVADSARRRGLGRRLLDECLERARATGMQRMVLVSSTKLGAALHLYESAGFVHRPMPESIPYETADVYMELELTSNRPG